MDIPHERQFHFHDGTSAGSLEELKKKLETIRYDEFYEHVNTSKNDFASWVEHVLGNEELAAKLRAVTSIVEIVALIDEEMHPPTRHDDIQSRIEQKIFSDAAEEPEEEEERSGPPAGAEAEEQGDGFREPAQEGIGSPPEVSQDMEFDFTQDMEEDRRELDDAAAREQQEGEELPSGEQAEERADPQEVVPEQPEISQRPPVTSPDPGHTPVTEMVQKQPPHPEHMRFLVKQTLYGFLLGLIAGLALGVLISNPIG